MCCSFLSAVSLLLPWLAGLRFRVQCPHCRRRFSELVAERHIPKCADIIAKPSGLKAGGKPQACPPRNSVARHVLHCVHYCSHHVAAHQVWVSILLVNLFLQ